jgi:ABC-type dipeptide/oligopeptide/nickel transport system permease subunit
VVLALVAATAVVVAVPDVVSRVPTRRDEAFLPPSWYGSKAGASGDWLGTDYLGRPFAAVLGQAVSGSARIALAGTACVLVLSLLVGVVQGSTKSRVFEALLAAGALGVTAVPEAAVMVVTAAAWPRQAAAWQVNTSLAAILVLFSVPVGARLFGERVRAVGRSGFVAAARAYGAPYSTIFWKDVWPHLTADAAWVTASVLPKFVAAEVGLAFLGVEYREFEGLGRLLTKSFQNLADGVAVFQLLVTVAAVLWVALLPQVAAGLLGVGLGREGRR